MGNNQGIFSSDNVWNTFFIEKVKKGSLLLVYPKPLTSRRFIPGNWSSTIKQVLTSENERTSLRGRSGTCPQSKVGIDQLQWPLQRIQTVCQPMPDSSSPLWLRQSFSYSRGLAGATSLTFSSSIAQCKLMFAHLLLDSPVRHWHAGVTFSKLCRFQFIQLEIGSIFVEFMQLVAKKASSPHDWSKVLSTENCCSAR